MLTKRIIPCLDVRDGKVVKGTQFLNIREMGDPLTMAVQYEQDGADELCFLDITASHEKRSIFIELVERLASSIFIPFTVGGGLSCFSELEQVLLRGADKFSINTAAFRYPKLIEEAALVFGSQCVVVAIDARYSESLQDYEVYLYGGRQATGVLVKDWIRRATDLGAGEILLTSMDRDGTKAGYDIDLLQIADRYCQLPVIASGGVGNATHVMDAIKNTHSSGFLMASIFHEKEKTIYELKQEICAHSITEIRPWNGYAKTNVTRAKQDNE